MEHGVAPGASQSLLEKTTDAATPCQNWEGGVSGCGYGNISLRDRTGAIVNIKAHRLAYAMHYGVDPAGLVVCHKCDNKLCLNPEHLFLGTQGDNVRDCVRKGRHGPVAKRFCGKGHYTSLTGKRSNGRCVACEKIRGRNRVR